MTNQVDAMSEMWNVHKAKTHLSALIDRALRGEDVVIARANRPVARLVALNAGGQDRQPGLNAAPGFWMAADFDDPLPAEFWLGRGARRRKARGKPTPK
jgi:prevent-host-death family protein